MCHLLYLMFRCDFDVMESLESWEEFVYLNTPSVDLKNEEAWTEMVQNCSLITSSVVNEERLRVGKAPLLYCLRKV